VPKVFVSSAGGALTPYRRAVVDVCHRLALLPVYMEEFTAESAAPLDACLRRVDEADVFVLLLAHRAGRLPPGETRTYTELEYERVLARPGVPIHAFVVDPDFPWLPAEVADPEGWRVRAFRERLAAAHLLRTFGDLPTFREDVLLTLSPHRSVADGRRPRAATQAPAYVARHPFTGRRDDLRVLDAWAASDDSTLVVESLGGVGKTALAWHWMRTYAARPECASRFWWSFYGGSASMRRFLQALAAHVSGRPADELRRLPHHDLLALVRTGLDRDRHLVVLDGLERLLRAYHRFDASALRDDEVDLGARVLIEQDATEALRSLVDSARSKVLVTTRLMPRALETPARSPLVGVRHHALRGLTPADTVELAGRLGVRGERARITAFFDRLGNHPLLIGVVAGLVNDYRPSPGDFDAWSGDTGAGGSLRLTDLDLSQRRTHVLDTALRGLHPDHRRMLGWLAVLSGAVPYATVEAVNPFVPPAPKRREPTTAETEAAARLGGTVAEVTTALYRAAEAEHREAMAEHRDSAEFRRAVSRLDRALVDLEDRGLLLWDRGTNTYDLHPVVRAVARDYLGEDERSEAHESVRDHFGSRPQPVLTEAASVEDLSETLTVFLSLVDCGCWAEALALYYGGLGHALRNQLAAFSTIAELLEPFEAVAPTTLLSIDLSNALSLVGRHEKAIAVAERALSSALQGDSAAGVLPLLAGLADVCFAGRRLARTRAYLELMALPAFDDVRVMVPTVHLTAVRLACATGDFADAEVHLDRAAAATSERPDIAPEVAYWRELLVQLDGTSRRDPDEPPEPYEPAGPGVLGAHAPLLRLVHSLSRRDFADARICAAELLSRSDASGCDTIRQLGTLAWLETDHDRTRAAELLDAVICDLDQASGWLPYLEVAIGLCELDREDEAVPFALSAYRQAWGDGPPNACRPMLDEVETLLGLLGTEPPLLPVVDAAAADVPLRAEILAFAARAGVPASDVVAPTGFEPAPPP
jgi:tetratricopeptide (TPR) repeat protein